MRAALAVLVLLALVAPCLAQPAMPSLESSPIATQTGFIVTEWQAYVGQKLQVTVKVSNAPNAGKLNGFAILVAAKAPSGKSYSEWHVYDDVVAPGGSVTKVVNTNVELNEIGKWTIVVTLYSKDKSTKYASDTDFINVVEPQPQPSVQITNLAGFAAVGAIGAVAGYLISRYY